MSFACTALFLSQMDMQSPLDTRIHVTSLGGVAHRENLSVLNRSANLSKPGQTSLLTSTRYDNHDWKSRSNYFSSHRGHCCIFILLYLFICIVLNWSSPNPLGVSSKNAVTQPAARPYVRVYSYKYVFTESHDNITSSSMQCINVGRSTAPQVLFAPAHHLRSLRVWIFYPCPLWLVVSGVWWRGAENVWSPYMIPSRPQSVSSVVEAQQARIGPFIWGMNPSRV
jgi:hypothetical protein